MRARYHAVEAAANKLNEHWGGACPLQGERSSGHFYIASLAVKFFKRANVLLVLILVVFFLSFHFSFYFCVQYTPFKWTFLHRITRS